MDAFEQSASVYALAVAIAKNAGSREELVRLALLFTQLGTTLSTLAAPCSHLPSRVQMFFREPFALAKSFFFDR